MPSTMLENIKEVARHLRELGYTSRQVMLGENIVFIVFCTREGKVATAVGLFREGTVVVEGKILEADQLLNLFTTGSVDRGDNFDRFTIEGEGMDELQLRVENCIFGGLKLAAEIDALKKLCEEGASYADVIALLKASGSSRVKEVAEACEAKSPEQKTARNVADALATQFFYDTEAVIKKRAEDEIKEAVKASDDTAEAMWRAVLAESGLRREALEKKFDTNGENAAEFIAYKQDVLMKLCCTCLPVIAKEAIGRVTLLDLYKPLWEGVEQDETRKTNEITLPMLGMFLVRRFMLQYDIQTLKLFSLLNKRKQGGIAAECSHFDKLWANQYSKGCRAHDQVGENEDIRKLSAKFGALRGLNQPTDEDCLKSWADYSAPAWFDCKKLGMVNGWVAESFEAALGPDDTPQPLVVPVAVRALMVSSGWADWFLTSYMKPIHATRGSARELTVDDLFAAPVVSEDVKSELRSVTDAKDAWRLIVELSNSLMDEVQRVDEGRKRSAAVNSLMGEAMDMSPPSKRSGSR